MKYYVNKNPQFNGEHEVHSEYCQYLPQVDNRKYLGDFDNCKDAVNEAKKTYDKVDGCYFCSNACHNT
jgi:hypothetical protein